MSKESNGLIRIVSRVDRETAEWLERRASDRECTTSAVIRWAVKAAMRAELKGDTRANQTAIDRLTRSAPSP